MLELYQFEVCPYCCKVKTVLDHKGLKYKKIEVNPMSKDELKAITDHKKVPVLVDGDNVVVESNDIIDYLEKAYPEKPIFAKNGVQRKEQDKWFKYVDDELVQILPANIYRSFGESLNSFKYITKVGKFPAWKRYAMAVTGAGVMTMVAKKGAKKRGITDPRKALQESLAKWAKGLGKNKFMGGTKPDVSDLICAGILDSVHEMKVWPFIEEQPKISDWYKSVQKAIGRA